MTKHAAASLIEDQSDPCAQYGASTDIIATTPNFGDHSVLVSLSKLTIVWALAMLVALPSTGSRVQDATLAHQPAQDLVRLSLDPENPAFRNRDILVSAQAYDVRASVSVRGEPRHVDIAELAALARTAKPVAVLPRPVPRPETVTAIARLAKQDTPVSMSTSGVVAAPIMLALPYAPVTSLRPVARPKGMERRMVQYAAG